MSTHRVIAVNTLAQILTRGIGSASSFFLTLMIARLFGVNGFGEFTKITTYVAFFYLIADFGLNAIFITESSTVPSKLSQQFNSFLYLRIVSAALLSIFAIGGLFFLPQGTTQGFTQLVRIGVIVFSISIIAQALLTTCNAFFQKTLTYYHATFAEAIGSVVTLVLTVIVGLSSGVKEAFGVLGAIGALIAGSVVTGSVAWLYVRQKTVRVPLSFEQDFVRTIVKKGWILGLTLLTTIVISNFGKFMLALSRSTYEVGVYGLAYKFFEFPLSFPTFFLNSLFPILVIDQKTNASQLYGRIRSSFLILLILSIVGVLLLYLGAPLITVIKPEFIEAVGIFRALVLFLPLFFLSSLSMWLLVLFERRRVLFGIYGFFMVINLVVSSIFIPRYGIAAATILVGGTELGILLFSGAAVWYSMLHDRKKLQ